MDKLFIRRAEERDIPEVAKLLLEVHKVHSDIRPDLFKAGARKYTDDELKEIFLDDGKPVFVAEHTAEDGKKSIVGYAFCISKQFIDDNNMTDVKTLYIDDLCVDENSRGMHVGHALYDHVVSYARENGYYNITLNVWAGNDSAIRFYEKVGLRYQKYGMELIL